MNKPLINRKPMAMGLMSLAALTAYPASSAFAAAALEEIVVTAQKRAEVLQDVPISITAVSAERLENSGIANVRDLPQIVPGMRIDQQGSFTQPTIRGIGSSTAGAGMTSNVATYIDGFYLPSQLGTGMEFLNLENIQVLKGPQGTLFGRNATGGAIILQTKNPSFDPVFKVQASAARFNEYGFKFYGSTGLSDTLAVDIAGVTEQGDGFVKNIVTGDDTVGEYDRQSYRASIYYQPTEDFNAKLQLAYSDVDDPRNNLKGLWNGISLARFIDPTTPVADGYRENATNGENAFTAETTGVYLTLEKEFGDITVKSLTMKHNEDTYSASDGDGTSVSAGAYNFTPESETISQEFNISGSGERLEWVVGAFYLDYTDTFYDLTFEGTKYYSTTVNDIESWALFADATYQVSDQLYVTAGVRRSKEEATGYMKAPAPFESVYVVPEYDGDWSSTTPRFVIRYEMEDSSLYASYTQGFRSGALNPASFIQDSVDSEEIDAYEVGYKLKTDTMRLDFAVYTYDFKDMQVASYLGPLALITNAASSSVDGADLQLAFIMGDNWEANVGLSYVDATFDSFPGSQARFLDVNDPSTLLQIDPTANADGKRVLRTPEYTANLGLQYFTELESAGSLRVNANLYLTDDFYFDSNEQLPQDSYALLNLRGAWTSPGDKMEVALFLNNATDEEYYTQVLLASNSATQEYGEPRSLGVSVSYSF